jgi:hypothetical protein
LQFSATCLARTPPNEGDKAECLTGIVHSIVVNKLDILFTQKRLSIQFVLLGICIIILLWFAVSHWQMQQAMRWWFKEEAIDRASQSDRVQNELIQDLFALRLSLQTLPPDSSKELVLHQQAWLANTENLHHHLIDLSAALTHPYLAESLPLALRSHLNQWQLAHPHCKLQLNVPSDWQPESFERNRVILMILKTLLKIALPSTLSTTVLDVSLRERSHGATLIIKITYPDRLTRISLTCGRELKYLRWCFHCLMPGQCLYQAHAHEAIWTFQWRH